jgi:hypothetical protein
MPVNPLFSCRVKIDRAHYHLMEFERAIEAFSGRNPNPIFTDEDTQPGSKLDRFTIRDHIPPDFSSFIGDIAHNLMSALDSLAVELAGRSGPISEQTMRQIYFPIHWEDGAARAKAERFFKLVSPDIRQLIEAVERNDRGSGRYLYWLHNINTIDKHRAIVPVAAALKRIDYTLPGEDLPPFPPPKGAFAPKFPLKNGDILAVRTFNEPEYHAHAHFALDIAFGENQVLAGQPVFDSLLQMIHAVEGTVHIVALDIFGIERWR